MIHDTTCYAGHHKPGCYCFRFNEQQRYPIGHQITHTPTIYLEPAQGYGVVVKHLTSGHLIVLFDSGDREVVTPFEITSNDKRG